MYSTLFRVLVVLVLLSSMSATCRAAEPDKPSDLEKRIAALEGDVKSIQSLVSDNQSLVSHNASQIGDLTELINLFSTSTNEQFIQHQQILDKISARDDNGDIYLTLNSIMKKSATAREEVREAVEQSIRKQGTLSITNEMGAAQDIVVNREQYRVQAGATLNLTVPVGTVSTQLPAQKIVNWTIGVPNYRQSIRIKPRYTTARVSSDSWTWVSQRPIYYDAPLYYSYRDWGNYFIYP